MCTHTAAPPKPCPREGPRGRRRPLLAPLTQPSCPQALLALPQKLEEVLVVVGGRALEEDEEGAEEPAPHPRNFAFYNSKASE